MPIVSAGILLYRRRTDIEVFIAHMGGPFWSKKDGRAWSVPKGLTEAGEDALASAMREFREEIGVDAPPLHYAPLGDFRQKSGKIVRVFVAEAPAFEVPHVVSNTFTLEWPPRSGVHREFAEIDDARWVTLAEARTKLVEGQVAVIDALDSLTSP